MWPLFVKHYLKTINSKSYWYIQESAKINGKKRHITIYVAPDGLSDGEMKEKIKLSVQKLINRVNELNFDEKKRKYSHKILTKLEVERLETLRFDYSFRFNKLYPGAFEQYKKANYVRYVHGTTAIEGNTFTLSETRQVLEDNITVAGKDLREQFEIQNYKKVREFVEESSHRFDIRFIKKLHSIICENIPKSNPGNFRVTPVFIAGMNVETSPAIAVESDLEDLIQFYKQQRRNKRHIVELAGIFHQRFEEIHPFNDGNGRVGREIINVMLERGDYPPVFFEKKDRASYLDALENGNGLTNDNYPIVKVLCNKLIENHELILEKVKAIDISNIEGMGEKRPKQSTLFEFFK